jgi:hypothetical protein
MRPGMGSPPTRHTRFKGTPNGIMGKREMQSIFEIEIEHNISPNGEDMAVFIHALASI